MITDQSLRDLAGEVLTLCKENAITLTCAESCTGGLIASYLTTVPGSSNVFERGFVTYTNQSKTEMLAIATEIIEINGAVSEPVARAMATGAIANSHADIAISVTGIAGPGGATPSKPVGLVHIAVARRGGDTHHMQCSFSGDRDAVRMAAVEQALKLALEIARLPKTENGAPANVASETIPVLRGRDVLYVFGGLAAGVILVGLLLIVTAIGIFAGGLIYDPRNVLEPSSWLSAATITLQATLMIGSAYYFVIRRRKIPPATIGFRPFQKRWWIITPLLSLIIMFLLSLVEGQLGNPLDAQVTEALAPDGFSWPGFAMVFLAGGLLAPFGEEMLFRGVFYTWLRGRWGLIIAVIASSVLFGAFHLDPYWIAFATFNGMVMALIYEFSRSIWPAIMFHTINNCIAISSIYLSLM